MHFEQFSWASAAGCSAGGTCNALTVMIAGFGFSINGQNSPKYVTVPVDVDIATSPVHVNVSYDVQNAHDVWATQTNWLTVSVGSSWASAAEVICPTCSNAMPVHDLGDTLFVDAMHVGFTGMGTDGFTHVADAFRVTEFAYSAVGSDPCHATVSSPARSLPVGACAELTLQLLDNCDAAVSSNSSSSTDPAMCVFVVVYPKFCHRCF